MTKRDLSCPWPLVLHETETWHRQHRPARYRAGSRRPRTELRTTTQQSSAVANWLRKPYIFPKMWKDFSVATKPTTLMTANEAASVTGLPLRQVHRLNDAGLLGAAVDRRNKARLLAPKGLVVLTPRPYTSDPPPRP